MKVEKRDDSWHLEPENQIDHDFIHEWFQVPGWSIVLPRRNKNDKI